ncbi:MULTISPECIES: WYL domain-containing protein [Rhodobacterales]|uniref:WYL domain-containing protein n=1 Tax=Neptunicoccus cionae TaxID=2035344 RepID=A0A916VSY1_9RHOB|nr:MULTISPECIES: WYL domain-containing protein [Rhodobacterales]MDR6267346.1 putative DNA-binding transcriptional regulator YafY [Roseobacter sp. N2S]GGA32030.1 WYL domain-containing protein [Amylibacter cionae]
MKHEGIKPSLRRRYQFIEFQLMWEGAVGRKLLTEQFEISPQQATLDLTSYLDLAPKNMAYDTRRRTYVSRSNFKPVFSGGEAAEYLHQLEMHHHGYRTANEIWPASVPEFDAVAVASRKMDSKVLRAVLEAIDAKTCLTVKYVSLSSDTEGARTLCPHALASDGHRWHMRAFDLEKDRYSDFVLSRIEVANVSSNQCPDLRPDTQWHQLIKMKLQAEPGLTARQKEQVEIEYSMIDGCLELPVRKAMIFYYLRFYGFDPLEIEGEAMRNKSSYRLKISNLEEIETCLERRK